MLRTITIGRTDAAPIAAREALRDVPGQFRRDDADLLVTELVTNAVRHGEGERLRLLLETSPDGGLYCEVVDDGHGFAPQSRAPERRPESGGWGLFLVDSLSRAWGVHEGSTHVWFEMSPDAPGPA